MVIINITYYITNITQSQYFLTFSDNKKLPRFATVFVISFYSDLRHSTGSLFAAIAAGIMPAIIDKKKLITKSEMA